MANAFEWIWYCLCDPEGDKSTCTDWSSCKKSCRWKVWTAQDFSPMKRYLLWVKIFLKHILVGEYFWCSGKSPRKRYQSGLNVKIWSAFHVATKLLFNCTNNMDEDEAWILGLKITINMNVHKLLVIEDSDFFIHQVKEEWIVKNTKITPYVQYIKKIMQEIPQDWVQTHF